MVLAEQSTPLNSVPTRFHPATPLSAADDINGVCIVPPEGYELHSEWTLGRPGQPGVRLRAAVVLTRGDTVSLFARSWSGELCLEPERGGPLPAAVREIAIWSSGPIVARRITWRSTHK